MSDKKQTLDAIITQGMLPLFFCRDVDVSLQVIRTLHKAGVRVFEYTNRGEEALDNFTILKKAQQQEMPDMYFGVGTIKTATEAETFISAGADFIVAPVINPNVANIAARHNMLWIPGCMTPTEILAAQTHGAELIKIFPANILGPAYIESIKDLFRGQRFMPTGGVDLSKENISAWFKAGVAAVGMGSKLVSKNVLESQLYDQLYTDTVNVLSVIKQSR